MTHKMSNTTSNLPEWKVDLEIGLEISSDFSCKYKRQWEVMFREIEMHQKKNNISARSCHRTTAFTKERWNSLDLYKVIWLSQTVIKL